MTQGPFMLGMAQTHLLHCNQKPPLVKPLHKCEVEMPKAQEVKMSSDTDTMLFNESIEKDLGNKRFFIYPFIISKNMSHYNIPEASKLLHNMLHGQNDHQLAQKDLKPGQL